MKPYPLLLEAWVLILDSSLLPSWEQSMSSTQSISIPTYLGVQESVPGLGCVHCLGLWHLLRLRHEQPIPRQRQKLRIPLEIDVHWRWSVCRFRVSALAWTSGLRSGLYTSGFYWHSGAVQPPERIATPLRFWAHYNRNQVYQIIFAIKVDFYYERQVIWMRHSRPLFRLIMFSFRIFV